jgi:hypothetical protein
MAQKQNSRLVTRAAVLNEACVTVNNMQIIMHDLSDSGSGKFSRLCAP